MNVHKPVLVKEVIDYLHVVPGKKYIDLTVGAGGHSAEIVKLGGRVLGIDQDEQILELAKQRLGDGVTLARTNFSQIDQVAKNYGFEMVGGILLDLGVSSLQLDQGSRGFSFRHDAPLDMRMDQRLSVTAADLLNGLHVGELTELFSKLGEETYAKVIAKAIVERREKNRIESTKQLADLVSSVKRVKFGSKIHPATQVFQALRIAVNDELNSLREVLPKSVDLLDSGGRLVVISFHSLEDRIVKDFFNSRDDLKILIDKPTVATDMEISDNPRSRSAKLRAAEKI